MGNINSPSLLQYLKKLKVGLIMGNPYHRMKTLRGLQVSFFTLLGSGIGSFITYILHYKLALIGLVILMILSVIAFIKYFLDLGTVS